MHFLVLGALLFVAFEWWGQGGAGSNRIVITPGQVDAIAAGFARVWQRPPTEQELKGLLDEHVREEVATRESMAMGLDRDDTVIRRRLRQKFEFLVDDAVDMAPVSDDDLRQWLNSHSDDYKTDPRLTFQQVFMDPARHGDALERDAKALLARLHASSDIVPSGDATLLPAAMTGTSQTDVGRLFGVEFAAALAATPAGPWSGPVESGYGLHLVRVSARVEGALPPLDQVRPQVERDLRSDRRRKAMRALYDGLLERYRVTIARRLPNAATEPSAGSAGGAP